MSRRSGRRDARRSEPHPRQLVPDNEGEFATVPGCCINDPDEIKTMRQITHDELIRLTGEDRIGGVRWLHYRGAQAREQLADLYGDQTDREKFAVYDDFLRAHGSRAVLIVAFVAVASGSAAKRGEPLQG